MKKELILKVLRLSPVALGGLFALSVNLSYAQEYPPIGRHYANTITLIPVESENARGMGQGPVVDVSGNGLDDAVFSGEEPGHNSDPEAEAPLYIMTRDDDGLLFNGAATIMNGPVPILPGPGARNILAADFNGDGRMDMFLDVAGAEPDCGDGTNDCFLGGQNWLLLSDNNGKLNDVTETNLPAFSDFSHGSSVADFDGDGDIDIWVNNAGGSPLYNPPFAYLMYNDGQGKFTVVADLSAPCCHTPIVGRNGILPDSHFGNSGWSVPIDADGDGDMDLYMGASEIKIDNEWVIPIVIWINDGEGHFEILPGNANPSPWVDEPGTEHALVYDLNRDGLDDMLLHQNANEDRTSTVLRILISNGDGTFRDETAERYPGGPVDVLQEFQLHDLDGDGHKDLFSNVNFEKNDIRINDGEGYFRRLADDWVQTDWNWTVLDVDGDGGTDFLIQGWQGYTLSKMNLPYGAVLDGTAENDRLIGGAHNNVYRGLEGEDNLDGGLGNDELNGGPGDDTLIGGKGNDSYPFYLTDMSGTDQLTDKHGRDTLEFVNFGLEQVVSVSKSESGSLVLNFQAGGNLIIEQHFSGNNHGVERLKAGDCSYYISKDPSFVSGPIQDLLGGCILFDDSFEGR